MNRISVAALFATCAIVLSCATLRAEEPAPGVKPPAPPAQPNPTPAPATPNAGDPRAGGTGGRGGRGGFGGGGFNGGAAGGGFNGGGGGGFNGGGFGGGGGITGAIGALGGTDGVMGMVSRMLGFNLEDPKAAPKLDQLPLGPSKRLVLQIPVGGVDNFNPTGAGWKMETVFKMTPEQTKSADALRDEYTAEEKKLNQEILDAEKALAAKVVDLRTKYEKKANELLTGIDKETKEKMDALAADVYAKNAATVAETMPLYDTKDAQQAMTMIRALRDKTSVTTKDGEDKLISLIPEDVRPRFAETLKLQEQARAGRSRSVDPNTQNGGNNNATPNPNGFRNRGMRGGNGGDAVAPPKAPEGDKF